MACAKKGNLPHFLPLLGKILVLRVLPAYRKEIGCLPLNPPAPAARGGYNLCLPFHLYSFFLPVCFRYIWCTPFKGSAEDPNFRDSQLIMLPSTFQLQSNSPRLVALENIGTGNIGVERNSNGVIRKPYIKEPTCLPFKSNNRVL